VLTALLGVLEDDVVELGVVVLGRGSKTYPPTATTTIITTITVARIDLDIALLDSMPGSH
jgi:hypothetical protein